MNEPIAHDLLGRPLDPIEAELLDLYRRLEALSSREDLPPALAANARQALVMLWNACNDLALIDEPPRVD
ncbi:MAG: hypothetical protein AB7I19_07190 [Planctomycetota bacterium]